MSNLGDSSGGSGGVGSDKWAAQGFRTSGTAATLQTVGLKLGRDLGASGTYTISLYDANGAGGTPGTQLAPIGSGSVTALTTTFLDYFFTLASGFPLAANTTYFIVLNSTQSGFGAALQWSDTGSPSSTGPGQIGGWAFSSNTGTDWGTDPTTTPIPYSDHTLGTQFPFQIGINAVPEPATYALVFGLALVGFALGRRFQRRAA